MPHLKPGLLSLVAFGLLIGSAPGARGQTDPRAEAIQAVLVDHGFENIGVIADGETVAVWFENRIYRYDMTALGVVASLAGAQLEPETILELIPENRSIPLLVLSATAGDWTAFLDGGLDARTFEKRLWIGLGGRANGDPLRFPGSRANRSHLRTDLEIRPLFDFQIGKADDAFEYYAALAPEAVMSPFPGALVTLQVAVSLHDDFDPCGKETPCGKDVKPVRNTLTWGGWLPGQWLATASGGLFPGDRYGFAGEAGRLFLDGQLELWVGADLSGQILFLDGVTQYSGMEQWSAFAAATHRARGIDLESTLRVGRFREGSAALRIDLVRRLHEFDVGFFGIQNEDENVAGIALRIPLPVRKYRNPARFRPTTVPAFPFTYRETVAPVGVQVSLFDNLSRLRKRLHPTFIRNNLEDLRLARGYLEGDSK